MRMPALAVSLLLLHLTSFVLAIDNGAGLTPAMGYNTWNDFRCSGITADHVKEVADKFDELKLKSFGYEYVNIDDCWCTARDAQGHLVPDPSAFPNGMKAVGDYIHDKGLKFGIYTDRGTKTCDGRPAAQGYEAQDAQTFASWGVDYLKVLSVTCLLMHLPFVKHSNHVYEIFRIFFTASHKHRKIVATLNTTPTSLPFSSTGR